ncbi:MAG: nucleotidyl transferase AbiEii/AbiGii toxin family protein [Elusimicrobiota bacterium]|nr:nucleotidyl transferase AbiEii/AbiGii toxin family protein [Elusimicrobiota bacterium]
MEPRIEPRADLASKVLPGPLYDALRHVFGRIPDGCMLVGGTALAGFYFGHRRSDDMDLFTRDPLVQEISIRAVASLRDLGAELQAVTHSPSYYRATVRWQDHSFTADVVCDPALFKEGRSVRLPDGIVVAEIETLLMTKAATLVSRCGEKDLYDLIFILGRLQDLTLERLLEMGHKIDGGMSAENVLLSVLGTQLQMQSCDFAIGPPLSRRAVYGKILAFQKGLIKDLRALAKKQPLPPFGALIKKIRKLQ